MSTKRLVEVCLYFLQLEERMIFENRRNIARFARRRYEWYHARLKEVRQKNAGNEAHRQRAYRPARV